VTIGLTLSTSAPTLSSSSDEPFNIIVTARILTTPHPDRAITLATWHCPFGGLTNRSFHNITCTTNPEKKIEIHPVNWPNYKWDMQDLRSSWDFVTIPPLNQGTYSVRHEVPRDKIEAANLEKGEKYKVALTDKCLGTRFWTFGSLEELDGVRFRQWRSQSDDEMWAKEEEYDSDYKEQMEKYGNGPVTKGEEPRMLALVPEVGEIEFDVT
jgi:hypothetical protein